MCPTLNVYSSLSLRRGQIVIYLWSNRVTLTPPPSVFSRIRVTKCPIDFPEMSSIISPQDVAERVGLDANDLGKPCQENFLPLIAPFVHPWRLVFSHLLTEVELDDVDRENAGQPEELKRLGCLRKWKSRNGAEATYKVIVQAAISSDRIDNAEAICRQLLREAGK